MNSPLRHSSARGRYVLVAAVFVLTGFALSTSRSHGSCSTIYNRSKLVPSLDRWTTCSTLSAIEGFDVQHCVSRTDSSRGHVLIHRRGSCPTYSDDLAHDEVVRAELKARGPDSFHVVFDGQYQRWASETPEYLGECRYRFPFRLASPQDVNVRIWRTFHDWAAMKEVDFPLEQTEVAQVVLEPASQLVVSPATCGELRALPTRASLRTSSEQHWYNSLPLCDRELPTTGVYLKAHPSDVNETVGGLVYQPSCRYAAGVALGTPAEEIQATFQRRSILFLGDSHVRIAFYKVFQGSRVFPDVCRSWSRATAGCGRRG